MYTGTQRNVYCLGNGVSLLGDQACAGFIASAQAATQAALKDWAEGNKKYMDEQNAICMDQTTRNSLIPAEYTGEENCVKVTQWDANG